MTTDAITADPAAAPNAAAGESAKPSANPLADQWLSFVDRYRRWLLLLVVLVYAAGFNGQWRLEPDSGLYLAIGRNLAEGHGYTFHGKDHLLAYPGVPLMFYGVYKAFGVDSLVPHLAVMWLMGLATLGLTYRLFLLHAGRPTAVLITLGVALSKLFFRYGFELLSDLPFLFGVMAFFVGYEAIFYRRTGAAGEESRADVAKATWFDGVLLIAGLGFAVAARPAMWALVAAAVLAALWSLVRGRARWGHLAVAGMVLLAVSLFYLKDPRTQRADPTAPGSTTYIEEDQLFHIDWERTTKLAQTAGKNVWRVFNETLPWASFGSSLGPGFNAFLALLLTASGVMLVRTRPLWGMWILVTIVMVLLVPSPQDRYFLPVLPILVFAWWQVIRWGERVAWRWGRTPASRRHAASAVFLILLGLGGVPNLLETFGFIHEQRSSPFLHEYKKGRYASAYDIAGMIERNTPPSGDIDDPATTWVCVAPKYARVMSLLSRRYCIEPDVGSRIDPKTQTVFVLEPSEPLNPTREPETRKRPTVRKWLADRGAKVSGEVISTVPNADPDDSRPWTLHRAAPQ